jgi:hypothetical protein
MPFSSAVTAMNIWVRSVRGVRAKARASSIRPETPEALSTAPL